MTILDFQNGNGTALYNNGNRYSGMFRQGFKEGRGVFSVASGDLYTGDFVRGMREGQGIEVFSTGERYVGQYIGDSRHGLGTAYYSNGQVKYTGNWVQGSPHGEKNNQQSFRSNDKTFNQEMGPT